MPKRRRRHKNIKPVVRRRPKRRRLMATNLGPWLRVMGTVLLVGGILVALYIFAVPPVMELMGIEWPPSAPSSPTPTPIPTPSPHPITLVDGIHYQRDLDLSAEDLRFASDPTRSENMIFFSSGIDEKNGPENKFLYQYDMQNHTFEKVAGAALQNKDIFRVQADENWIVYLDNKREGGGFIRAIHRSSGESFVVKEYYAGMPEIRLAAGRLVWTERTGTNMDKVFLYDLATRENLTLARLERSLFGQSSADISEKNVVWAEADSSTPESTDGQMIGSIRLLSLSNDGNAKQIEEYQTGMYVHDPRTNGEAIIWTDQNRGPNPKLYISLRGGEPQLIAEGVSGYDIGTDFVAYCANQVMYVYFYGPRGFDKQISLAGEKCIFAGFGNDTVFYYVTGGISLNDIVKYVQVNEIDTSVLRSIPTLAPENEGGGPGAAIATPPPRTSAEPGRQPFDDVQATPSAPLTPLPQPAVDER